MTSIIGILNKPALIPWAVQKTIDFVNDNLEKIQDGDDFEVRDILYGAKNASENEKNESASIGTKIHEWVENFIKTGVMTLPENPKVLEGVNSFIEWKEINNIEFVSTERIVYSKKYKYVGMFDIEAIKDDKRFLIDIKTGNGIYKEVRLQTSAYVRADEEERRKKYDGRYVLKISKEDKEEYEFKMMKKGRKNYPEFAPFEFVFLDDDPEAMERDFNAFLNCLELVKWKKKAKLR